MIEERELVMLTDYVDSDEKEELLPGDLGLVVYVHPGSKACTVEFLSLEGIAVATATLLLSQVRAATYSDMTQLRLLSGGRSILFGDL